MIVIKNEDQIARMAVACEVAGHPIRHFGPANHSERKRRR